MNILLIKRIKKMLEKLNLTQADLAKATGIRASSISDYLSGKYDPKQDKIYLIAKALNVSPAWLMGLEDDSDASSGSYYTDPEVVAYAEELRTNPNMRILFSAAKDISKEDMEKAVEYITFLKSKERPDNDFSE